MSSGDLLWCAGAPGGVGDGLRLTAGEDVEHADRGGREGRRGGAAAQPHQVRGEDAGVARGGDEPAVPVEDPLDQRWVHGPQRHHDRQAPAACPALRLAGRLASWPAGRLASWPAGRHAGRHQGCPNVAPGTGGTVCQAPSLAEAAAAAMTSASACASSIVELRRSPPATATRNFLASMTFRSS
jgi:hypothetical protein